MDNAKPILESKTVWANAIGLVAVLLSLAGLNTSLIDADLLAEKILQAIAAASFILSTVFRVIATKRLDA